MRTNIGIELHSEGLYECVHAQSTVSNIHYMCGSERENEQIVSILKALLLCQRTVNLVR